MIRTNTLRRRAGAALAATGAVGALAAPAAAHVGVSPTKAPADGFAMLQFSVPHGCDGSPTRALRVRVPRSVPSATPHVHPGWEVTTRQGPKTPVELHGEEVTRGVSEIAWTATEADPLPEGRLDLFGVSVKLPAGEGETVYFPAVQECVNGRTGWIQVPAAGESAEELDEPAPAVLLTAPEEGHGDGEAMEADVEPASASAAAGAGDDGPSTGLVIAALVLGGLGLLTGLAALLRGRGSAA